MKAKRAVVLVAIVLFGAGTAMGQTTWLHDPPLQGLDPGPPGSWDDGGCWVLAVVFDGSVHHLWYAGIEQSGDWNDIGHATSIDGVGWDKDPQNPVLTHGAPGELDDEGMAGAAVIWDGSLFHMWYGGLHNDYVERACYATSPDGTTWAKQLCDLPGLEPGVPTAWDADVVRPTTVIIEGDTYRMWYNAAWWAGPVMGWAARVGYAESLDGINWDKRPYWVLGPTVDWEFNATALPYVVFDGSTYHMWFSGGQQTSTVVDFQIGYAYSSDGTHWTKNAKNPVITTSPPGINYSSTVRWDGSTWRMWHEYSSDGGVPFSISYATSTCCAGIFGDGFDTGDTDIWNATVP
jgi:hypothetical protein